MARVQTHLVLRGIREQPHCNCERFRRNWKLRDKSSCQFFQPTSRNSRVWTLLHAISPMTSVAGDFYDFIVVDENRVGILIADVSGHGMPAALIASMLKIAFAAQVPHAADPAQVLSGLNQALCGKFEHHFVTAAYVFVDMAKGTPDVCGRRSSSDADLGRVIPRCA